MSNVSAHRRNKNALVLAGGGLSGMVYEAGALQALDAMLTDFSVNDFDIYVGTSAGAVVASLLANGLDPEAILDTVNGSHPQMQPIMRRDVWRLNGQRFLGRILGTPQRLFGAGRRYLTEAKDITLFNVLYVLLELLPTAVYHSDALEGFTRRIITELELSNEFRDLDHELHIIATRLDTGERALFNRDTAPAVLISEAVAASSAVPVLYHPYRIRDVDYVDGAVRGNASLDVAVEQGAELVICINPLVPYDNTERAAIASLSDHEDGAALGDTNMQAVVNQVLRIWIHAGLHYHLKQLRRAHPHVDFVLIEPDQSDDEMSFQNVMRYGSRLEVARHAQATVWKQLQSRHSELQPVLAKHGLTLRQLSELVTGSNGTGKDGAGREEEGYLFATPAALLAADGADETAPADESGRAVLERLQQSLDRLEAVLQEDIR